MQPPFALASRPEYEDDKLIVKMQSGAEATLASMAGGMGRTAAFARLAGMSALGFYERAGLVRRVIPVTRRRMESMVIAALQEASLIPFAGPASAGPAATAVSVHAAHAIAGHDSGTAAAAALFAAAPGIELSQRAEGYSIVELEPGTDTRQLQLALAQDPSVASVSLIPRRYLAVRRSSAATVAGTPPGSLWNLQKIRWQQARALPAFADATTVKVGVLDSGIDRGHPDLAEQVRNYVYEHPNLPGASSANDVAGHGTHVAGTIAAVINNLVGVNGVCDCELHAWKIFDDSPERIPIPGGYIYMIATDDFMYRRALLDCADEGIDVVNLSIGGSGRPDQLEMDAFADLIRGGTVVVAAMGNEREDGSPTSYPAAIPGVIAVGATDINDRVASFSNRGPHITLAAPGVGIWSTTPTYPGTSYWDAVRGPDGRWRPGPAYSRDVDYGSWNGTSMASPHVAGAVALLLANKGRLTPAQVQTALAESCDKVSGMDGAAFDSDYGNGRLNLERLLG